MSNIKYYAKNGSVTTADKSNDIFYVEITKEQYIEALQGMAIGKVVSIINGFNVNYKKEEIKQVPEVKLTLTEAKQQKKNEITHKCLVTVENGFTHYENEFDSDPISQTNIIGTVTAINAGIPLPEGFTWRTKNNEELTMSSNDVVMLGASLLVHRTQCYKKSWLLKSQIHNATTIEEVDNIKWED